MVFEPVDGLPAVFSDEGKISQILRNFISNALKFTEKGEVRVSAEVVDGDHLKFNVADTGIGIAKEDQERIFQDFAQVDNPIQKRVKGTGLGLPLSRKLAHLLGGEVELTSELGLGSTFSVVVPLAYAQVSQPVRTGNFDIRPGMRPLLIIENSDEAVLLYERWLKDSDFQVVRAASLAEARQALAATEPVAIVLDILLRGEDSWRFLETLKQEPANQKIPVLVITTIDDRRKGYHLGADGYLIKPVDPQAFRNELRRLTTHVPLDRILIIDDNERDRYLLRHGLRSTNLLVSEASSGMEGLAKARQEVPRIIFLDLAMPEMSGFEVFDRLRSDPSTRDIPVIINTSMRVEEVDRKRLDGSVAVLSKQHSGRDEMLETVQRLLEG